MITDSLFHTSSILQALTRLVFQPYTFQQLQKFFLHHIGSSSSFHVDAIQIVARKVAAPQCTSQCKEYLDLIHYRKVAAPQCTSQCKEYLDLIHYRCSKSYYDGERRRKCGVRQSFKAGTWLQSTKITYSQICQFVCIWLTILPPRQRHFTTELGLTSKTIVEWSENCRDICLNSVIMRDDAVIGGEGIEVEIDEAKFGKRKYNRGTIIPGKWVVGGFERQSGRCFFEPVNDRSADTLIEIIQRRIAPGSVIYTDLWRGYNRLPLLQQYQHLTVNHSQNFVDPVSGAHTQNIERTWRTVRSSIPRFGISQNQMAGYLTEFCWKKKYNVDDRVHFFWLEVARLYTPINNA